MAVPGPITIEFSLSGPDAEADLPGLCDRVCTLAERSGAAVALCDASAAAADARTIETLARLQLAARKHGCHVHLCVASQELRALIRFVGLGDVLRLADP